MADSRQGMAKATIGNRALPPGREIIGTYHDLIVDGRGRQHRFWLDSRKYWCDTASAFLIGRGWSATQAKWKAIEDAGIPVMAINDYPKYAHPRMYVTGDPPSYFRRRIWLDPEVTKFCCIEYQNEYLPRSCAYGPKNQMTPAKCPNVAYFHKSCNESFEHFLSTPWVNWGTLSFGKGTPYCPGQEGFRSSMLIGLRILYHLGFRKVYLLGSDFVPTDHPHKDYFQELERMLGLVMPVLNNNGMLVVQANVDSWLRVFPMLPFDNALEHAKQPIPNAA